MGCAQLRIDNEESVSRCRERRILMKDTLSARTVFVIGHSAYAIALKNAGSALSDFGRGETPIDPDTLPVSEPPPPVSVPEPPPPPLQEPLPPPPPPLPNITRSPLQRSVTMPEFSVSKRGVSRMESLNEPEEEVEEGKGRGENGEMNDNNINNNVKGMAWDYFFMSENMDGSGLGEIDEEETEESEDDDENDHNVGHDDDEIDFKTPEKAAVDRDMVGMEEGMMGMETPPDVGFRRFVHSNTAPPVIGRFNVGNNVGNGNKVKLMKVLEEIDDYFLKASECAQEVTKVLEAHKFQYHSSHGDNRGLILVIFLV